ncbi:hypothetical protein [Azohydromonas australica]|uniref:hypothetical protein n=1 Tax=Azohydromonas australica TaxID=364039 RepID=UPI0004137C91|nr:hypothetical protein [Azohydromonas australica]
MTPGDEKLVARLHAELSRVARGAGEDFTGTGCVVCRTLQGLPSYPLNPAWPQFQSSGTAQRLLELSRQGSAHHDGFHLLSPALEFLALSCYVAAPVMPHRPPAALAGRGSRYATAWFSSMLPQVACVGIVSQQRQVSLFCRGELVDGDACATLLAAGSLTQP